MQIKHVKSYLPRVHALRWLGTPKFALLQYIIFKMILVHPKLYQSITHISEILPDQVRCGEHSDYGSVTLLFQDSVGGLEVHSLH